jgi:hypothetical protein
MSYKQGSSQYARNGSVTKFKAVYFFKCEAIEREAVVIKIIVN